MDITKRDYKILEVPVDYYHKTILRSIFGGKPIVAE